jgi:hypothetical protein
MMSPIRFSEDSDPESITAILESAHVMDVALAPLARLAICG